VLLDRGAEHERDDDADGSRNGGDRRGRAEALRRGLRVFLGGHARSVSGGSDVTVGNCLSPR
jgi:hypothetical protein